jgi:hypothetical protein
VLALTVMVALALMEADRLPKFNALLPVNVKLFRLTAPVPLSVTALPDVLSKVVPVELIEKAPDPNAEALFTQILPPLMVTPPLKSFAPLSSNVPAPDLEIPPVPLTLPVNCTCRLAAEALGTVNV